MLILGTKLSSTPIMSLQTGTKLATAQEPIINPSNLKIMAYKVSSPMVNHQATYLRVADIREFGRLGFIIDSIDEFISATDVINIKKLIDLDFNLVGLSVINTHKKKLGKVIDYTVDINSFFIQQVKVKRGILSTFGESEFLVHRSQIVEINNTNIVVKDASVKKSNPIKAPNLDYVNPFKTSVPQNSPSD